jgi:hypothetical protein
MKKTAIPFAIFAGIAISAANTGVSPCPPTVTDCSCGHYGLTNTSWVCCVDSSHVACVNYFKKKWLCDSCDPGDPASFGYTISQTSDSVNFNCDTNDDGYCY